MADLRAYVIFWLLHLLQIASGQQGNKAYMNITFVSYTNPDGRTNTGSCCEAKPGFCVLERYKDCDTYFGLTVLQPLATGGHSTVRIYNTKIWQDTNSIQFGSSLGSGISNPIRIDLPLWNSPDGYKIKIMVKDKDDGGNGDDLIADWSRDFRNAVNNEYSWTLSGGNDIRLNMKVSGYCMPRYYGADCQTYCVPQISYNCDPSTGRKVCSSGYEGRDCMPINECLSNPCLNGGLCVDGRNSYSCRCPPTHTGRRCETVRDNCPNMNCNNGICSNSSCHCYTGFTGSSCDRNVNDCQGVTCNSRGTCIDQINDYRCDCEAGFTGKDCLTNIDDCQGISCNNQGSCRDMVNAYRCECNAGFTGRICESNINDCVGINCSGHGMCIDMVNAYRCECNAGFTGRICESNINDCVGINCSGHGRCIDMVDGYRCQCTAGFTGDHCRTNIDDCQHIVCQHGNCSDGIESAVCHCDRGYTGRSCDTNINDCQGVSCGLHGSCSDHLNRYICNCDRGFTGTLCETDIDDCAGVNCGAHGSCNDEVDNFRCQCDAGFTGSYCETEIDECEDLTCYNNGTCIDGINIAVCECSVGYTGLTCETDINECVDIMCYHGICEDLIGSYRCNCRPGFTGHDCADDIDECHSSPCHGSASCSNQVNGFECYCPTGFTGTLCDINPDDCANITCIYGECVDGLDTFVCHCDEGYTGRLCETTIDKCASHDCVHGECMEVSGAAGYRCLCKDGYNGILCDIDIDECGSSPCLNNGTCIDGVNGYTCSCKPGYSGSECRDGCLVHCVKGFCTLGSDPPECLCYRGYEGINCERETNECEPNPCDGLECVDKIEGFDCIPDDDCAEDKNVVDKLARSFCLEVLDSGQCQSLYSLDNETRVGNNSTCFSLQSFRCSSLTFSAVLLDVQMNNTGNGSGGFVCKTNIDSTLLCRQQHLSPSTGPIYCLSQQDVVGPVQVLVVQSGPVEELIIKYWYYIVAAGTLVTLIIIAITIIAACKCHRRKKRYLSIRDTRLPDIPYELADHAYEGIDYSNPLFDSFPRAPTDEELKAANSCQPKACSDAAHRRHNAQLSKLLIPLAESNIYARPGEYTLSTRGEYYTEPFGQGVNRRTNHIYADPLYSEPNQPSPPPLPPPPTLAFLPPSLPLPLPPPEQAETQSYLTPSAHCRVEQSCDSTNSTSPAMSTFSSTGYSVPTNSVSPIPPPEHTIAMETSDVFMGTKDNPLYTIAKQMTEKELTDSAISETYPDETTTTKENPLYTTAKQTTRTDETPAAERQADKNKSNPLYTTEAHTSVTEQVKRFESKGRNVDSLEGQQNVKLRVDVSSIPKISKEQMEIAASQVQLKQFKINPLYSTNDKLSQQKSKQKNGSKKKQPKRTHK